MEILNYDNNNSSKNGYKQLYPFMPKDQLLICGNSDSGKTNLLCHILQSPLHGRLRPDSFVR